MSFSPASPIVRLLMRSSSRLSRSSSHVPYLFKQPSAFANPFECGIYRPAFPSRSFFSGRDDQAKSKPTSFDLAVGLVRNTATNISTVYNSLATTRYGRLMRLDKPTGTHLLFLPAAWSISLGAQSVGDWVHLTSLFYAGSILLRGAGCTINDIWDADIDRRVARTCSRPIAAGEISTGSAFVFLGAQLAGGLVVVSQLNSASFLAASLVVLPVMFYPFAKRHTAYPQAILGLTFNSGAILGCVAATGGISMESLMLYGAGWCWTMVYDTIYAHQDKEDDAAIGISSTALSFQDRPKVILSLLTAGKVACLVGAGVLSDMTWPYYAFVSASGLHVAHQVVQTDLSDPKQCQDAFDSNVTVGMVTWLGIVLGRLV